MKDNWQATTSGLRYAGMDFLAYVEAEPDTIKTGKDEIYTGHIKWGVCLVVC